MVVLIAYVVIGGTIAPYGLLVAGINRIGPVAAGVTGMIEPMSRSCSAGRCSGRA